MTKLPKLPQLLFAATALLIFCSSTLLAETAEERGLQIARESKLRDTGWGDMQAEMAMILRNREGQESRRQIQLKSLEILDDGDKSLTIFEQPADVKGTAFLSFSHPVEADEQWLYLPALKRVKRIASKNKSGPFMGSEFAYEDLSSFEIEKFTYRFIGEEAIDGLDCFVVEQFPQDPNSGYTRRVAWIDREAYRPRKIDFYDRKDSLLKTLSYRDYAQYLGEFWRAGGMSMVNHQTGKSTELTWRNYRFQTGLTEQDFNKNSLKRAR